jgi:RNA polymerase sigma factor (sigma-70 family)
MARGGFAPFLSFLHARRRSADGDAALLARFAADRDEAAFAELLRRHGPLVWRVCRQVLGNDHDAEDAFQATFLLLARGAASVHDGAAVAGWLHGTAWRVARRARAAAAVRRCREGQAPVRESADAVSDAALRELQALLHEEVARLPAKYRAPFVACVLEGRSRAEVAQALGWNEGTLSTRLAWARRRLRARLLRRGVDVAAALCAVELTHGAANSTVPTALAHATTAAARTGAVSAPVAALMQGGVNAVFTTKLQQVTALALLAAALAAGTAALGDFGPAPAPQAPAAKAPPPAAAAKPAPAPKPPTCPVTVTGTATGPDGQPVKGAAVTLCYANYSASKRIARTVTDDKGRYEFRDAPLPVRSPEGESLLTQVGATAPGMAITWSPVFLIPCRPDPKTADLPGEHHFTSDPQTVDLQFGPPAPFQGRIVDEQGRPIAGVKVSLDFVDNFRTQDRAENTSFVTLWLVVPEGQLGTTTDRDGRFRLAVVPKDCFTWLSVHHPDYADATLSAFSHEPGATVRLPDLQGVRVSPTPKPEEVWTGDIDLTLFKPRAIPVRVVDSLSGRPVPKIYVSASNSGRVRYQSYGQTDADGRVRLRLPPGEYKSLARGPRGSDYIWYQDTFTVTTDAEQPREVRLVPGCVLKVEAIDADTGRPLAGVTIGAAPQAGGPPITGIGDDTGIVQETRTDARGQVRITVAPGKRQLTALLVGYDVVKGPAEPVEFEAGKEVKLRFELRKTGQPPAPPPPAAPPSRN